MKKILIGILAASIIFATSSETFAKEIEIPEDIYMWVQSTSRGNYFFNTEQINYSVKSDGTIDLYTLNVPTLCTYDDIQIEDVIQKRRWKNQSLEGYDILAGRADYLTFDFKNRTVQVTRRVDLDDTLTELDSDISGDPIKFSEIPRTSVMCNLYRTILTWARSHNEELIAHSTGKLSASDSKLDKKNYPINKIILPGDYPSSNNIGGNKTTDGESLDTHRRKSGSTKRIR